MGKTLFLHVGLQKTGTTTIQTFLTQNQALLAEHGWVYPDPTKVRIGLDGHNHGHLALCLTGYWRDAGYQLSRKEAWGELRDLYFESDGHLLISTEALSTPQIVPHVRFIKKMLRGIEVKVIIYLRRQDIFVQSVYKERLKGNEGREFQRAYEEGDYRRLLDFDAILDHWQRYIGKENIIVRVFERGQLVKGDVLEDFLHTIGADGIQGLEMPTEYANSTMNRNMLEISRALNQMDIKGPDVSSFKWWLNNVLASEGGKGFANHSVISPENRLAILRNHMSGNEKIARDFLGRTDGQLFYEKLPDSDEDWQPYAGVPPEDVARMLAAMFKKYSILA